MMKTKLYLIAAVALLTACTESDSGEPITGTREIMLNSSVAKIGVNTTRAVFEDETLTDANRLTALVLASNDDAYTDIRCEGTMTFTGSGVVAYNKPLPSGSDALYPIAGTGIYLTGLYPATGWTIDPAGIGNYTYANAQFTITGKEDVMVTVSMEDTNPTGGSDYQTLEFKHMLTWIKIKLTGNTVASTDKEITVSGMKLTRVNNTAVRNLLVLELGDGETVERHFKWFGSTTLTCWAPDDAAYTSTVPVTEYDSGSDDLTDETTYPVNAYVLAPPVMASDTKQAEYTFEVTYNEKNNANPITQVVDIDLANIANATKLAGKYINLHLHFNGSRILADATIQAWGDGGDHEEEI